MGVFNIKDLNLGDDTAEYDKNLINYFLETPVYDIILSGKKSIILGRKGAGKTALYKYMQSKPGPGNTTIGIETTFATLVKIDEQLKGLSSQVADLDTGFRLAWLTATILSLIHNIIENKVIIYEKEHTELYEFAVKHLNYSADDPASSMVNYILSWAKDLKKVGPAEREVPKKQNIIFDESKMIKLLKAIDSRLVASQKKMYLFYDKLDDRWNGSPTSISFLQGLLNAYRDIKSNCENILPVILLRKDIYEEIAPTFQHLDHIRSRIQEIVWNEESLEKLISLRIKTSLSQNSYKIDKSNESNPLYFWDMVFTKEMPAKKQAIPTSKYMIDRTLFRPRDIIYFCNECVQEACSQKGSIVSKEHLQAVEERYSEQKLQDLQAEISAKYPNSKLMFDFFKKRTIGFNKEGLQELLIEAEEELKPQLKWLPSDLDEFMLLLYRFGFFSYTEQGGHYGGSRVIHSGNRDDSRLILDQTRIYITPIFRKALKLKDH